jgi:hypothetical protein
VKLHTAFLSSIAAAITLSTTAPVAHGDSIVTFDSADDLSQFSLNGGAATTFTYNSTIGVGGDGGLKSSSSALFDDAAIFKVGFANTVGSTLFTSLDFRMQFQFSQPDLRVGFTTTLGESFDGPDDVWVEMYGTESPKGFDYVVNDIPKDFSTVPMAAGNWFRLRLEVTRNGGNSYSGAATVSNLGSNGLANPTVLSNEPFSFTSASLGAAQELFAGFYFPSVTTAADNFSTGSVPELGSLSLLVTGIVILLTRRPMSPCTYRH